VWDCTSSNTWTQRNRAYAAAFLATSETAGEGDSGQIQGSANQVRCMLRHLAGNITITLGGIAVYTASATHTARVGVYDLAGNRLAQTAAIDVGGTGSRTAAVSSTALTPGAYYLCWASSDVATLRYYTFAVSPAPIALYSSGMHKFLVSAANAMDGSGLPATLGTLTTLSDNPVRVPRAAMLP
jgi:hypothetical protein